MITIIILTILLICIIIHFLVKKKDKSIYYTVKPITWLSRDYINFGYGNGYVGINKNHPCYGKDYDDIPVKIHGGLTYAKLHGDYWVLGFDTAHHNDSLEKWPYEKVLEETINLKNQLKLLYNN